MSPERDDQVDEREQELYEDVPPRSIFAATWFRVVLVVIVLGVIGAVAVPYVLDWMNPPPPPRSASARSPMVPAPGTSTSAMPSTSERPATDQSVSDKPAGDRTATSAPGDKPATDKPAAEKKDTTTTLPAPMPPASMSARTETPAESKPAAKAEPKSTAKPAAKPEPPAADARSKSAMAPADAESKTAASASKSSAAKPGASRPGTAKTETPPAKSDTTPATAAKPSATRQASAKATTPSGAAVGGGPYWVQVGAFKDADAAKKLAAKLRDENFKVEESLKPGRGAAAAPAPAPKSPAASSGSGSDQYDVFVSGMSAEDLNRRLAGKGLTAEAASGGVVVKPSLPLRDAVALSKDLAVEGFKVQVRRSGGSAAAPAPAPAAPAASSDGGSALHRVRVGAFSDRAAAVAAARELEAKGYKPYIARGDQ